ncbi:50S ribosomal protein L13 [Porphyromonas sp. COT-239 OH1446]|uniref:50S ribosomal protein L13 n=1 Tax=Porphyromonas sp. COT-239 OH1446 TaxID=1515613 RepID=UPI00052B7421|nr:50S ribosomal protein L13 [Porphyromonas sp. COT-239 OH1446]KGN70158.1 50S ribosomal protein L13 [Porphyromonas sp. COT-239 OH1446]
MDTLSFKTVSANKATVSKGWVVVDAEGQHLGRLCSKVAKLLRGKYKPNFTPHVDCGDNVIVINADKVVLTGKKWDDRVYLKYSGYPGGQRQFSPRALQAKGSDRLFRKVVKGMLPKNRLGDKILGNLFVYDGAEHKHAAQQPVVIDINTLK